MATSEHDDKHLRLTVVERKLLIECLTVAISELNAQAALAKKGRRPIEHYVRDAAGQADTLRDRLRRL